MVKGSERINGNGMRMLSRQRGNRRWRVNSSLFHKEVCLVGMVIKIKISMSFSRLIPGSAINEAYPGEGMLLFYE